MRRKILLACFGLGALGILGAALLGPELVDGLRLQSYVARTDAADVAAGGAWPRTSDVCATCHGQRGNSLNSEYPGLAGQPHDYVAAQLHAFAKGERINPNMGPLAQTMSETEIDRIAKYFAQQTPTPNPYVKPDPRLTARGRQVAEQGGCVTCHGKDLMGHDQFPRLAGQGSNYIARQLDSFASGARTEPTGSMKAMASAIAPDDRRAVAAYLAALPLSASIGPK